jgi:UDP-N-acetylmuramate--alanine ligase
VPEPVGGPGWTAGEEALTRVDLARPQRVHVVGIGGAGMRPIALVLIEMGHSVSGSDQRESPAVAGLRALGVDVVVGHDPDRVAAADLVAASSAVPYDDPELVEARRLGRTVLWRAHLLGALTAMRRTLAVSGTKGKTTTTAMLAAILERAGWDPSYIVGGDLHGVGQGARWRAGEWLVVEADESDGTFLALATEGVVVTNVQRDHLDFYGGEEQLASAFGRFVAAASGPKVIGVDDPGSAALVAQVPTDGSVVTFGTVAGAGVRVERLVSAREGATFDLRIDGVAEAVTLAVPGAHNAANAAAAAAMATAVGIPFATVRAALAGFREVARRFERRGERDGVTFIDDYAHLPSALAAVLATARQGGWARIVAVFQPHRYSRTESIHRDFADAFVDADVVVLTDVYAAGEAPRPGVDGRLLVDAVLEAHPDADVHYVAERSRLASVVGSLLRPGDVCLSLGAGDLDRLADELGATTVERHQ